MNMELLFVTNGTTQLVLIPENELDRLLLERIMNGPNAVDIDYIRQPMSVMGQSVTNGVVIRNSPYNDPNKT